MDSYLGPVPERASNAFDVADAVADALRDWTMRRVA